MSDASNAKKGFLGGLSEKLEGVNLRQNGIFLALLGLIIFFAATTAKPLSPLHRHLNLMFLAITHH